MERGLVVDGKYHLVQLIGQGGMGAVYDAIHGRTGRRVALKLLDERLVASANGRRRFEREARAAASIDSRHVVQILDFGEDGRSGMPYLVMEFLQGEDLRSLVNDRPLSERLAVAIALQICFGLAKAHEEKIVHRDLKPANIFIAKADGGRRVVKILDFGVAKIIDEGESSTTSMTSASDILGTPSYMSPEQVRAPNEVDSLTDIWALGVILYKMLTGQTPTSGIASMAARAYAICHTPAVGIRELAPHISPELAAVVHRALAIERSDRFSSANEMASALRALAVHGADTLEEDLARLKSGTGGPLSPSPEGTSWVGSMSASTVTMDSPTVGVPKQRSRAWLVAFVGLAVLGLPWAMFRNRSTGASPAEATASLPRPPSPSNVPNVPSVLVEPAAPSSSVGSAASSAIPTDEMEVDTLPRSPSDADANRGAGAKSPTKSSGRPAPITNKKRGKVPSNASSEDGRGEL